MTLIDECSQLTALHIKWQKAQGVRKEAEKPGEEEVI
jgi:hypothetical protein